jgi:hypothetical protein
VSFLRVSQLNRHANTVKRNAVSLGSARTVNDRRGYEKKAQKVYYGFGSHEPSTYEYGESEYLLLTYCQSESEAEKKISKTRVHILRILV